MIRYVHIGDQICDGEDQFAFYDTVTDRFIEIGGNSVFDSFYEFIAESELLSEQDFSRLRNLIPHEKVRGDFDKLHSKARNK